MHDKIIHAFSRPSINPFYGIQNREFLLHWPLQDLFGGFSPFKLIFVGTTLKIKLLLLVGTLLYT
jgi:hypothetical protein